MNRFIFLILFLPIFLTSCLQDECTSIREFAVYTPVMMHANDFRMNEINVEPQRPLENPGKLYFYDLFLLINEAGKGIHFYDVSNPANPVQVAFYNIPGNFDMAIRDNILYADNVIDLIAIDIINIQNPRIISRVENYSNQWEPENQMFQAYAVRTERVERLDCSDGNFNNPWFWRGGGFFVTFDRAAEIGGVAGVRPDFAAGGGGSGVGGSFARFTLHEHYLYTVDHNSLLVWDIDNRNLEKINTKNLGWGIETIFPYEDKLFIGSNSGMFIFDNSNPSNPVQLSVFQHAMACDPVVVEGNYAYVTLRDGNECQGFINQMDVVDITSLTNPVLVRSYPMTNPHGLAINQGTIYLGEGRHGLRVLDASNPDNVRRLEFYRNIPTYDVIYLPGGILFVVGEGGFFIFDAADNKKIKLLSEIRAIGR
ncbi:MAG TPA: hypothetical protein PKC30_10810 [Saprospiraceae bacterium]|nr:hypothetical protein [Saprospiraceae bacterium]